MTKIILRHGLSEANNRYNAGRLAFASADAPLMREGFKQARNTSVLLEDTYGSSIFDQPAAVSTLLRTQQTATAIGLHHITTYSSLDEVTHEVELPSLRYMLDEGKLPPTAIRHAELILDNPPEQGIWVTHGLVIAGLCNVLGIKNDDWRLIPKFCEMRELPIS